MGIKVAKELSDFDITLEIRPLNEDNYDDYYVKTKEGRGQDPTSKLIRRFLNLKEKNPDKNLKVLFSGFIEKEKF